MPITLSRRDFLKLTGAATAVTAATLAAEKSGFLFKKVFTETTPTANDQGDVIAFTTCYMCLGRCTLMYVISSNQIIRYAGGDVYGHVDNGATCPIGPSAALYYLSPARMKYPLLRVPTAERGQGNFIRISWDDMLDIIVNGDNAKFLQERGWK